MIEVPLRNRQKAVTGYALVDDEDADLVGGVRWHLYQGYARRSLNSGPTGKRVVRPLLMHRHILGLVPGDGLTVDHINRNRLDNRRENLRVVTYAQNMQNRPSHAGASSPYRGVSWSKAQRLWVAHARIDKVLHHIGSFADEVEAARAAQAYRDEHMPYALPDPLLAKVAA